MRTTCRTSRFRFGCPFWLGHGFKYHRLLDLPTGNQCLLTKPLIPVICTPLQPAGRPSAASSLSDTSGRAPMCWITSAAASAPSRAAVLWSRPRASPNRKPAANRSPAPVASTSLLDRHRRHRRRSSSLLTTTQPFSLRVTAASLASLRSAVDRGVEIRGLVEALQLALVGEHQIDRAVLIRSRNSAR